MSLRRLQLSGTAHLPVSSQGTNQALTVDAALALWARQGYLEKARVGAGGKGKGPGKRARATQAAADDEHLQAFEWRWGPRALSELGEQGLARFVAEFMAVPPGADAEGDEDAVGAPQDEGTQKRVGFVYRGIERAAAGGSLLAG